MFGAEETRVQKSKFFEIPGNQLGNFDLYSTKSKLKKDLKKSNIYPLLFLNNSENCL